MLKIGTMVTPNKTVNGTLYQRRQFLPHFAQFWAYCHRILSQKGRNYLESPLYLINSIVVTAIGYETLSRTENKGISPYLS